MLGLVGGVLVLELGGEESRAARIGEESLPGDAFECENEPARSVFCLEAGGRIRPPGLTDGLLGDGTVVPDERAGRAGLEELAGESRGVFRDSGDEMVD